jgi:hypothetical protein
MNYRFTLLFFIITNICAEVTFPDALDEIKINDPLMVLKMVQVPFMVKDQEIKDLTVESNCRCIASHVEKTEYQAGESGLILNAVNLLDAQGYVRRTIKISWTDHGISRSKDVDICFRLPEIYTVSSKLLRWKVSDRSTRKVELVFADKNMNLESVTEEGDEDQFIYDFAKQADGRYHISVAPKEKIKRNNKNLILGVNTGTKRIKEVRLPCFIVPD